MFWALDFRFVSGYTGVCVVQETQDFIVQERLFMRRSSLSLPITLGVIMIVCLLLLMVGWVTVMLWGALSSDEYSLMYWVFLVLGTLFLATILGSAWLHPFESSSSTSCCTSALTVSRTS